MEVSKITSVYDGETFRAHLKDMPKIVGYRMSIRINDIDTPEKEENVKKKGPSTKNKPL